jgi:hypothetical protein
VQLLLVTMQLLGMPADAAHDLSGCWLDALPTTNTCEQSHNGHKQCFFELL